MTNIVADPFVFQYSGLYVSLRGHVPPCTSLPTHRQDCPDMWSYKITELRHTIMSQPSFHSQQYLLMLKKISFSKTH